VIGGAVFVLISQEAIAEAQRSAEIARVQDVGVVEPALLDGLRTGDPGAVAAIDRVIRGRVLDARTVRVKIWDACRAGFFTRTRLN
jgi:hypothetical protein